MDRILAELLSVLASTTLYGPLLEDPALKAPAVTLLPQSVLEQVACRRPCPVYGLYEPARGILLDDRLDLENDAFARGILLHELVHFAQWHSRGGPARSCEDWLEREREAYRVQFEWLQSAAGNWRGSPLPRPRHGRLHCHNAAAYEAPVAAAHRHGPR